jgi:hypothetical protein
MEISGCHRDVEIIENTREAAKKFGHGFGSDVTTLTDEHFAALKAGKALAMTDGEYSHFFVYEKAE